jgi:hypothetical protein
VVDRPIVQVCAFVADETVGNSSFEHVLGGEFVVRATAPAHAHNTFSMLHLAFFVDDSVLELATLLHACGVCNVCACVI